jgi:CubicO group peptidase (beta-lactamase class C family)
LSSFADAVVPSEMAKRHIPGAVVVVIDAGKVALARGYGFADLATQRQVNPERTIFRLASVSKRITATAALQLVEQERLTLTQDANDLLTGFKIPSFADRPITLHDLLTHTAGFDERLTGVATRDAATLEPLATYLAQTVPPRFVEPGRIVSYSNQGIGFAFALAPSPA